MKYIFCALVFVYGVANAANESCLPLQPQKDSTLWFKAISSSEVFSKENRSVITIAIIPGTYQRDVDDELLSYFRERGVLAQCFEDEVFFDDGTTRVIPYLDGSIVELDGKSSFAITEIRERQALLDSLILRAQQLNQLNITTPVR